MTRLLFFTHDHLPLTCTLLILGTAVTCALAAGAAVGWAVLVERAAENAAGDEL